MILASFLNELVPSRKLCTYNFMVGWTQALYGTTNTVYGTTRTGAGVGIDIFKLKIIVNRKNNLLAESNINNYLSL